MMTIAANDGPAPAPGGLGREVALVFAAQMVIVFGLVQLDAVLSLQGNLHAFVGLVFVILPVVVLDRRGKPYRRYGIHWGRPFGDLLWAVGAMVVCFTPLVFAAPVFWRTALGIATAEWRFAWPAGYPEVALSHLLVVALPEEFFYRGYLMGRLDDIFTRRVRLLGAEVGWSLPLQAVFFALGHFLVDFNPQRLAVFFPALAFGWLRARRGAIGPGIVLHAGSNVFMEILRTGYGVV